MKTIFFFSILLLIGCTSIPSPADVFNNNYSDFFVLKDKLEMDDRINSFQFKNTYSYVIIERKYGRITVDDKKKNYCITVSYPHGETCYYSKEDLFLDIGMDVNILSGYLSFFNKHQSFSGIGHYSQTLNYHEISNSNVQYFSLGSMKAINRENAFLKKINKKQITYRFTDFTERLVGMTLGDAIRICYSHDIDLSELSQEELLIFGFKWIKKTAYTNWYEIGY
jgi:hypothetical protein